MTCLARHATRKNGNGRSSFHSALLLYVTRILFSTWCLSTGKGPMCAINRSSIFFLLSIQIHLCDLVRSLYVDITVKRQRKSRGLIWKVSSVGIPCLLMAISYGGLFEFRDVCYGSLMVPLFLMTNTCHQLNVAGTVRQARTINSMWRGMYFRAQWGLIPFDPFGALACAVCRRRIKFLDVSVVSALPGFPTWAPNGVGITCIFFLSLFFILWCLSLFSRTPNSNWCLRKRTSVVRHSYFLCPMSPFFSSVVTLLTFPLVIMLQKGPLHLEQRIFDFVLPGL